jgi:hypothetical protein
VQHLWAAFAAALLFFSPAVWGEERITATQPFNSGERLTFVLKWTIVPAGEAVLEVMPQEKRDGIDTNHFALTARSNEFVDAFFMVRDRIDAWTDSAISRSVLYKKNQREGRTRRDINVTFDWAKKTAQYTNEGKARNPISIADGTFDPLSIFYWFRSASWEVGDRVQRTVTDGKKIVVGVANVIRKERIKVPAGVFDTFLVEPDISHVGGVFEKSPEASIQLWVSADSRRIPVRLKSKVVVGSFSGELVSMTGMVPLHEKP